MNANLSIIDMSDVRSLVFGRQGWGSESFSASSGPDGAGTIPVGDYDIGIDGMVENPADDYCGKDGNKRICFFIPVEP